MDCYIDVSHKAINKYGEELCGDKVETLKTEDGYIIVLSDGLGSGVKANILATLTSKIAITMLKSGSTIEDTLETIISTLPECKVRELAYSTFTMIKVKNSGECYMVEYENPPTFFYRDGAKCEIERVEKKVSGKKIYESNFKISPKDLLVVVSDGVIHAGVGEFLNFGWQWDNVDEFLKDISGKKYAMDIATDLLEVCKNLYNDKPGDDTTVLALKMQPVSYLNLFTGPPRTKKGDKDFIEKVEKASGIVVLSGGTTANIISKAWNEDIIIDMDNSDYSVPPIGFMKGVDLVTEGQITLSKVVEYLREYKKTNEVIKKDNGAKILTCMLLEKPSHINIVAGTAVNKANQNLDFSIDFSIKIKIINELVKLLRECGKTVTIEYI